MVNEFLNENTYSEEADYKKDEFNIKELILRHLRKIGDICCKEFTGGYWEKKPVRTQSGVMFTETYHEDVREAYCNAMDFLIDIIYPMGDSTLKTYLDNNENFKDKDKKENKKDEEEIDIKDKLKLKRRTFREINIMFSRTNFWQSSESSNE